MRILHMIWGLNVGGAERQLAYMAPLMARRGHDVHIAFVYSGVHAERLSESGCTLHQLRTSVKYDPLLFIRSASLLRRLRPEIVHTWLAYTDLLGFAATRVPRRPWVMSERSAALLYPPLLLNRLRAKTGRWADAVVPNSPGGAEYWIAQGVDPARIEVIPNYVPSREIDSAEPVDDVRLAEGDQLVVHVGRLSPEKNLSALIDAMQRACRIRPRVRLAICGDGLLRSELQAQVRALGIEGRVIFTGFVQNVPSWLKRASLAVSVSPCEGHPNAVLEAVAAGVPVVVSDIAAHRSMLADDAASFVSPTAVQAIADAIVQALDDRGAALERAARARQRLAPFSLEEAVERYEEVYLRAIGRAAK